MANTGKFYTDEELTSTDLQNAVSLLASSFNTLVTNTMYNTSFVIINGLGVTQSSTADNGVQVASGLAFQNGQTVLLASQQGVNILPGSYANGTGLAADSTNPRIDVVYIEYTQQQTNSQTRTFNPPGQTSYQQSVNTELTDGYTLSVVHGTAAASPVAPSAPAGSVVLAQVTVPANATTITTSDITDTTSTYRNDGGRLALATNNLLQYVNGTTLGTPSGFTLKVGTNDYIKDNTTTHRMDMQGGTNGINMLSSVLYSLSGTPIVLQPTTDATSGTHVLSLKNASGAEYGYVDNTGVFSGTFNGNGAALTSVHAANSDELGGVAAADYLRTDSAAPNPQSVANPITFNSATFGNFFMGNSLGAGKQTQFGTTSGAIAGVTPDLFAIAESGVAWVFGLDHNGNFGVSGTLAGTKVFNASGELGSASGTWTPASGSLNVAAGTVINVSAVPTGAKLFFISNGYQGNNIWGVMTNSGASWSGSYGTSWDSIASAISSTSFTGNVPVLHDGTYEATGYFQINGGYLQFVVITSTANTSSATNIRWGVS